MTDFGDEMRDLAVELIDDDLGVDMTYQTSTMGAFDPATQKATEALVNIAVKGSPPFPFRDELIDGDTIQQRDMQTFLAEKDLTFTPDINGVIIFNSVTYRILKVEPIYSDEREAAWRLHLRGN